MAIIAKRMARPVMVLVAAVALGSCVDQAPPVPEREGVPAQTNAIRLYLDNEPVMTIFDDGKITLGPIVFMRTSATLDELKNIRAELLDRDGNVINASRDDVRINFGTNSNDLDFLRDDEFSGRLRSESNTLPATYDVLVGVYDMNQRRTAIGPYTVRLTARLP